MKLVAVSIVKNEADIIEAFVRHTAAWVDLHFVFDHDSTDGTREILGALVREGCRLCLFTDTAVGNFQQRRSNFLTRLAATDQAADWILPLDADEFLQAPDRAALEAALGSPACDTPVSFAMANYFPSTTDAAEESNPVLRIRDRVHLPESVRKIAVPRTLALDPTAAAVKGSHAVTRAGSALPDRAAPADIFLAHFPQRSLTQQVVRVVSAELQKLSRGAAHAGVDTHYRRPFQLLAEHPDVFAQSIHSVQGRHELAPIDYRGGVLRFTPVQPEWMRASRALLPFLEKLARSHGELVDRLAASHPEHAALEAPPPAPLPLTEIRPMSPAGREHFQGFRPHLGWQPREGPFASMLLPPFHWALAPETILHVDAEIPRAARLEAEAISYAADQRVGVLLNGAEVLCLSFPRVDEPQAFSASLQLRAGVNVLTFACERFTQTAADPRKLGVIFTALRVV